MNILVSDDFASMADADTPSSVDNAIQAEVLAEIGRLKPRLRMALQVVRQLHPSNLSVKELAAIWNVSTQRVYQLAQEGFNELRERFRSDDE